MRQSERFPPAASRDRHRVGETQLSRELLIATAVRGIDIAFMAGGRTITGEFLAALRFHSRFTSPLVASDLCRCALLPEELSHPLSRLERKVRSLTMLGDSAGWRSPWRRFWESPSRSIGGWSCHPRSGRSA